ncbi:MarR family transcriptional regulator [Streptacidiphilus sp. EB129]|uniref:MarR family transcriptional regulator n=1 Tax=Streptacidiphilus sp. EB129 TaxID=3156262 RepID=UPI00351972E1
MTSSARRGRVLVDEDGVLVPTTPYAFSGRHASVDKRRVRAICASKQFSPAEKFLVLWFIGATPEGGLPVNKTGKDIADEVGMTADAVNRMLRKLAKHRILNKTGAIGNISMYSISPYIAYHGSGHDQSRAVKNWNPPEIPGFTDVPLHQAWEVQG